jgi:two-component system chemotaxis response regulator CheY
MPRIALIIDDSPVIRQVLRLYLEERRWWVSETANAYDGLRTFREIGPQLIILDLLMPLNNGIDAIQLAQMIGEEDPAVTLLIFSSFGGEPDLQAHFIKHQVDLFEKPSAGNTKFDKLFERIDRLAQRLDAKLEQIGKGS